MPNQPSITVFIEKPGNRGLQQQMDTEDYKNQPEEQNH
jgi:hypothetical protein